MKILKKDFRGANSADLCAMDSESDMLINSFMDGLRGVGEMMQQVALDDISDEVIRNVGGMLVAIGHVVDDVYLNKSLISDAKREG